MIHIDLLYFDGCPAWHRAWAELGAALAETGVDATLRLVDVMAVEAGARRDFAGSPTIHVDGRDLEGYEGAGVLACRRYDENEGRGWPSASLIRSRLLEASGT